MRLCADTSFLIALYSNSDSAHHAAANEFFTERFERARDILMIPWPVIYETLNTRFVSNRRQVERFDRDLTSLRKTNQIVFCEDNKYREQAFKECLKETERPEHYRGPSLVDRIIRAILLDKGGPRTDALLTYTKRDFADVCARLRVELLSP